MRRIRTIVVPFVLTGCALPNPAFDPYETLAEGESGEAGMSDTDEEGGEEATSGSTEDSASGGSASGTGAGDTDGDPGDSGDSDDPTGDGDGDDSDGEPGDGDGDPGQPACGAPLLYADCDLTSEGLTTSPFRALGLGCEGGPEESIELVSASLNAVDPDSWRVASHFGVAPGPNHGEHMWAAQDGEVVDGEGELPDIYPNTSGAIVMLSTGTLPEADAEGGVVLPSGTQVSNHDNLNESGESFPAPISPAQGSNFGAGGTPFEHCDGVNDCSDSLYDQWFVKEWNALHDRLWLSFELKVPEGVHGFMFDFAFFSSEYPTFVDTQFNDMFIAWTDSSSYTGTLTFVGEAPMSTTSLAAVDGFAHVDQDPALAGTGFEGHASTGWLLARGPAVPGETIEVTLYLSDLGDANNSSVVLLDNFRWDCAGCSGADCGFEP